MKRKLKNGDIITMIYGETAKILSIGNDEYELTKLDRRIHIGNYADGVPCINSFIITSELYEITKMVITEKDLKEFSPSKHVADIGDIMMIGLADGFNGTKTEMDYSKLNAGSEEQFHKNCRIFDFLNPLKREEQPHEN